MQRFLKLFFSMAVVLMIAVGCSAADSEESQDENKEESNNKEEAKQAEKDDPMNEEVLVERLIQEMNDNKDTLLKDGNYHLTIQDRSKGYHQNSSIGEDEDKIEVRTVLGGSEPEFYGEKETYELNSGLSGEIGELDEGYVSFISSTDDKETEISLGELSIEEGKKKLDNLEFRDEEITEEDLKEMIGLDYEDVKYFDNKDTKYDDVTEVFIRTNVKRSIGVRYRNRDAGEYDAVDVYVSKEEYPRSKNIEPETKETDEGKKVEIVDDGLYVDWYWEQDGYYYNISGNYNEDDEEDDAKKEYNLEVIDNITKEYGE